MKEELLHFIWKYQLLDINNLKTKEKENIQIIDQGTHNQNAGPDFLNAKVKIDNTLWAGNIEIHINASDWFAHKHQLNKGYQNVILHVVFNDNLSEQNKIRLNIPVLEISNIIDINLIEKYEEMIRSKLWIPCYNSINKVTKITKTSWLNRLIIDRLENRYEEILAIVEKNNNDWLESFYQYLVKRFGFKTNSEAMLQMAEATPLKILSKHKNELFQVEALLYGQAGMLTNYFTDSYPRKLFKEYSFLKSKYQLQNISSTNWKYSRLRPPNFPTIRIAQFSNLLFHSNKLFSKIIEAEKLSDIFDFFNKVKVSSYWQYHYQFEKFSKRKSAKKLGKKSIENIIINTIIPFLFVYGKEKNKEDIINRSIAFLEELPAEKNSILDNWEKLGFENNNAAISQALLQLKKEFCNKKKCLECGIGTSILK